MEKVLIIDDDIELCDLLSDFLSREGFVLERAYDGKEGLQKALDGRYDLIILDVMLPEINGFEVLRQLRLASDVPVLMLTARGDDIDRIVGLEMGSDDYLPKPFNARELSARIRAILRRALRPLTEIPQGLFSEHIEVGEVRLDPGARTVTCSGENVPLTAVEFRLLEILLKEAGNVITRERLCESVLERPLNPYDRSIDVHISSLRKKLWKPSKQTGRIKAVRGAGYVYARPETTGPADT